MKPRVYIKTMLARRQWTRRWWDGFSHNYELVTSGAVVVELHAGRRPHRRICSAYMCHRW